MQLEKEFIQFVGITDGTDLAFADAGFAVYNNEEAWMELPQGSLFLDESRRNAVTRALRGRIERLGKLFRTWFPKTSDAVAGDVMEDTKYSSQSR